MKDYPGIVRDISGNLTMLRGDIPPVMQGFSALAQAATKPGVLFSVLPGRRRRLP